MFYKRSIQSLTLCVLCFLISALVIGCATTTVFTPYTHKSNEVISMVQAGDFDTPLQKIEKDTKGEDKILYLMERGRIAQIGGKYDVSQHDFEAAIEQVLINQEKAKISASETGANAVSIMLNDNSIPFKGSPYEVIFLYQLQSMNYLMQRDLEGAGVEVRRANLEQDIALEKHQKEIAKAEEKAAKEEKPKEYDPEAVNNTIYEHFNGLDSVAGRVKNSFQNAYTFYVSGLIYELRNENNDAYIDYAKALEIYPDNFYVQCDVMRLAKKLGMKEEYESYANRFPEAKDLIESEENRDDGELIVLYEDGLIPQKQQIKVPLPLYKGIVPAVFPIYNMPDTPVEPLMIKNESAVMGKTHVICDVRALAVKAFKEQLPGIIFREITRITAKTLTSKQIQKNTGLIGSVLTSSFNWFTSNADLRSWYTLPDNVQILRVPIEHGPHTITIENANLTSPMKIPVNVETGKKTILRVSRLQNSLFTECQVL